MDSPTTNQAEKISHTCTLHFWTVVYSSIVKLTAKNRHHTYQRKAQCQVCGPCPWVVDQEGPRDHKTKQSSIGIIFHSSPDPDRKILLLKIPYILVTGHREILVLSRKFCALWLVFTILEGTMQPAEGEQSLTVLCDWGFDQRSILMGRTLAFLFCKNLGI